MSESRLDRVLAAADTARQGYYRLVLLVGPPRGGKTRLLGQLAAAQGWPRVNVNLALAEQLLELTQKQRAVHAARLLGQIVEAAGQDTALLDNTELLFGSDLAQDPLKLLQGLARNRTVVATWCGSYRDGQLVYAEPGHPEHRRYSRPEAVVVTMDDAPVTPRPEGHRPNEHGEP